MTILSWNCKTFDTLSPHELYSILRLRNEVFVVEQHCVFQDADDRDQQCFHLLGFSGNYLIAYARLVPPGISYTEPSIGRVVTAPAARSSGAGKQLMSKAIEQCYVLFKKQSIKIGAQLYLKAFYESFGFIQIGEIYDEDGIDHIHMIKEAN